ncbi:uncharacterized protein LOC134263258 [Saccostrea cucullata]|uniref:uncharacterized protein LOC134263258 n=1 Tax=Saccostrea cuccullata TaxID=36930 RepID=UPI002ED19365
MAAYYTVNQAVGGNLIYVGKHHYIRELSTEKWKKVESKLVNVKEPWVAKCVYSSPSNGDLLVGVLRYDWDKNKSTKAKVVRCISTGKKYKPKQVIGDDNTDQRLYECPLYITENHNGDVIVSDQNRAVVVTECGGKHCYSYTGPSSEERDDLSLTGPLSRSRLLPLGLYILWVGTSGHKQEICIYRYIQRKNMERIDKHY